MRAGRSAVSGRAAGPGWAAAAAAAALHAAGLWLLMPQHAGRNGVALADPPLIEIEMVDQAAQQQGAPAPNAGQPPPPPPEPPPESNAETGPPPPPPPATPAPPARAAAPAVNLGSADEDQDALTVTGDNVVPPRPDAQFHNKPPAYPADAARRNQQGVVHLRARVGTAGIPEYVEVEGSSGYASLDRAARDAVALWRFEPARSNGVAVPFDYYAEIAFNTDARSARKTR